VPHALRIALGPPRTLPGSPGEVRIHQAACAGTERTAHVQGDALHPSGYYTWRAAPQSPRAKDDQRLVGLLKQALLESGGVYGYRKLTLDSATWASAATSSA
jgi:hypothetical protein